MPTMAMASRSSSGWSVLATGFIGYPRLHPCLGKGTVSGQECCPPFASALLVLQKCLVLGFSFTQVSGQGAHRRVSEYFGDTYVASEAAADRVEDLDHVD